MPSSSVLRTVEEKNESGLTTIAHNTLQLPTIVPTSSRKGRRVVVSTRNAIP